MSTETLDKGSSLVRDIGEVPIALLECLLVQENLKIVLSVSPMKFDHEDIRVRVMDHVTFDEVLSLGVPNCVRILVQGNPGAGKSFVIRTISNINVCMFPDKQVTMKVAPICCSALIFW